MYLDGTSVSGITPALDKFGSFEAINDPRQGRTVQLRPLSQFTGCDPVFIAETTQNQGLDRRNIQLGNLLSQKSAPDLIGLRQLKKNAIV